MKKSEYISCFLDFMRESTMEYEVARSRQSDADNETQDLLHRLELHDDTYHDMARISREEIYARTREKLTKRDYIEPDSIKTSITAPDRKGRRTLRVTYSPLDAEKEVNKDIRIDGAEVTIE